MGLEEGRRAIFDLLGSLFDGFVRILAGVSHPCLPLLPVCYPSNEPERPPSKTQGKHADVLTAQQIDTVTKLMLRFDGKSC